jgi:hypothetical protein
MHTSDVFTLGLGLQQPWYVADVKFTPGENPLFGQVDIYIDFERGGKFPGPDGGLHTAHDTVPRTWQHLNFFQHKCLVHANMPPHKNRRRHFPSAGAMGARGQRLHAAF